MKKLSSILQGVNYKGYVDDRIVNNNCIDVKPGFYNLDGAFAAKLTKIV